MGGLLLEVRASRDEAAEDGRAERDDNDHGEADRIDEGERPKDERREHSEDKSAQPSPREHEKTRGSDNRSEAQQQQQRAASGQGVAGGTGDDAQDTAEKEHEQGDDEREGTGDGADYPRCEPESNCPGHSGTLAPERRTGNLLGKIDDEPGRIGERGDLERLFGVERDRILDDAFEIADAEGPVER